MPSPWRRRPLAHMGVRVGVGDGVGLSVGKLPLPPFWIAGGSGIGGIVGLEVARAGVGGCIRMTDLFASKGVAGGILMLTLVLGGSCLLFHAKRMKSAAVGTTVKLTISSSARRVNRR